MRLLVIFTSWLFSELGRRELGPPITSLTYRGTTSVELYLNVETWLSYDYTIHIFALSANYLHNLWFNNEDHYL